MNNRDYFETIYKNLLDPLAVDLAEHIKWVSIKEYNNDDLYPYISIGRGKTILFLHGFDSCFLEFRRIVPLLSKNYRIIIPDLFGFGFCPRPLDVEYSANKVINHLSLFVNQIMPKKDFGILGASMGGSVALNLYKLYTKRVKKIFLLAPAGITNKKMNIIWPFNEIGASFLGLPYVRNSLCRQAFSDPNKSVGEKERQIASIHIGVKGWKSSLSSFASNGGFYSNDFIYPKQSINVVLGMKDRILTKKDKQEIANNNNYRIQELENCGHLPHLDQPYIVSDLFRSIFK